MTLKADEPSELRDLGPSLLMTRHERGLSQVELARRCGLSQAQISYFELGQRRPTLEQLLRIAKALDSSIQKLLTGSDRPGTGLREIAFELRSLGWVDLWIEDAVVPGAFRTPEELIPLTVSGAEPDPRILEAVPAILAWNELSPKLLRAHSLGTTTRTARRLAWLADIALAIDRRGGFPGGCKAEQLRASLKSSGPPRRQAGRLGQPGTPDGRASDLAPLEAVEDQL